MKINTLLNYIKKEGFGITELAFIDVYRDLRKLQSLTKEIIHNSFNFKIVHYLKIMTKIKCKGKINRKSLHHIFIHNIYVTINKELNKCVKRTFLMFNTIQNLNRKIWHYKCKL